jgi:hypothetical protein
MVLAEYVRDEVEGNLLSRAAQFSPAEADQVIEDFGYSGSAGLVADPQHKSFHARRSEANRLANCCPGRILPRTCPGNFMSADDYTLRLGRDDMQLCGRALATATL